MIRSTSKRAVITAAALLPLAAACVSTPSPSPSPSPAVAAEAEAAEAAAAGVEGRVIELTVTDQGFVPSPVMVEQGVPLTLVITRTERRTCATEIMIPAYDIEEELPLNQPVTISFTPKQTGEIRYGCGMGQMIGGVLVVE